MIRTHTRWVSWLFICLICLCKAPVYAQTADVQTVQPSNENDAALYSLAAKLPSAKLNQMESLVTEISQVPHPKTREILSLVLNGDLYYIKSNRLLVAAIKVGKEYELTDVLHDSELASVKKSKIRKVRTNNRLRGLIRSAIAVLDLNSPNKDVRLQAVKQLLDNPSTMGLDAITLRLDKEEDPEVSELMNVVLSLNQLKTGEHQAKLVAVSDLESSLQPEVRNTMANILRELPQSQRNAQEAELAAALNEVIKNIDAKRSRYGFIENVFFGLSLGSVLLLAAIGLAITFGVMGVINMAHGEMIMLGAYTTYVIQITFPSLIEYSLLMAIPAAFLVSGFVGVLIERGVIRFLKGRPLETLLATFGVSLILQQLVRTVFSPLNRQVQAPEWMTGSWVINPVFSLTYNRLYIIIFSLVVFFTLMLILKKSSLGLHVRAVSQNRDMARALSIKSDWVDAATFGLGSGIAGVAGVVLSQLTNVGPNLGQAYIIDSFLVVVFGGVGNLWGTLVAAMSLGTINKFLEPITGSVLANIIVLVGLVLFIQKRPKGLFPQKGRSAD
ncbi:urea ABC transporter permease subunit UrtB [Alteromonas sp. KS69]|jgi:urea transport system permease protein|uniref:Branched-chain amino acid ABC transporter permease n=1 Tax=Alteromonas naphthalenivorans TaxID=715451 RepID=F5Z6W2_ALTNA|nr:MULTISPECIES: urea ABC transporter permease subunit UrtB [Alteromonas]AGP94519.1 branched-chain amino acid ABC transporter permease [Alteromonas mediterranea U8]MEA3379474.1 urea ABC transporter permease subunit UrtB [Pseudomonadota bacterium]AEF05625.1 branched-chain amino acid ABC transporter permease [Alteromonas naphthalenivorans]AGP86597.1 branched-chain amino acid ABC transporter permease [Alteromonas mediterranea U4]AGP90701.1 branched-chain amino acid ABC transporter permease [Alter